MEFNESTNSTNSSEWHEDDLYCSEGSPLDGMVMGTTWFQVLIFTAYVFIFAAALIGNGLVVISVRASPRMRTVTNLLLVNLAFSDLLLAVACVPFSFVPTLVLQYWPFGASLCKLVSFSQVSAWFLLQVNKRTGIYCGIQN
jgi:7 transmembrane receptor (rhodopsin family)